MTHRWQRLRNGMAQRWQQHMRQITLAIRTMTQRRALLQWLNAMQQPSPHRARRIAHLWHRGPQQPVYHWLWIDLTTEPTHAPVDHAQHHWRSAPQHQLSMRSAASIACPGAWVHHAHAHLDESLFWAMAKNNPNEPCSGLICPVPLSLLQNPHTRAPLYAYAQTLHARVSQISTHAKHRMPLYVVFIHDAEPHGHLLNAVQRETLCNNSQINASHGVLGAILDQDTPDHIAHALQSITNAVVHHASDMIAPHTSRTELLDAYALPHTWAQHTALCAAFWEGWSACSANTPTSSNNFFLRGIHHVAGIAPRPILDRVAVPDHPHVPRNETRTYQQVQHRRIRRRLYALGLFAVLSAFLCTCAIVAYHRNAQLITRAQQAIEHAYAQPSHTTMLTQLLSQLRAHHHQGTPLHWRFGMYQGRLLHAHITRIHREITTRDILAPYHQHVRHVLERIDRVHGESDAPLPPDQQHELEDALRAYLWLTSPGSPQEAPRNADAITWLTSHIAQSQSIPNADGSLRARLTLALHTLNGHPARVFQRDDPTVHRARQLLNRRDWADYAIDQIVQTHAQTKSDLSLSQLMHNAVTPLYATARIPYAFTRDAWNTTIPAALAAAAQHQTVSWIYGTSTHPNAAADSQQRGALLRSRYVARYIAAWSTFIRSVSVQSPTEPTAILQFLTDLTITTTPPMTRLLQTLAYHTQLPIQPAQKSFATLIPSVLRTTHRSFRARIRTMLRTHFDDSPAVVPSVTRMHAAPPNPEQEEYSVRDAFSQWTHLAEPDTNDGTPPAIETYHAAVTQLRDAWHVALDSPQPSEELRLSMQRAEHTIHHLVQSQGQDSGWHDQLARLLWHPIRDVSQSMEHAMQRANAPHWCRGVVLPYRRTLQGKYPFNAHGPDAALDDVAAWYRPVEGHLWRAYTFLLQSHVQQHGDDFSALPNTLLSDVSLHSSPYTPGLMHFLQRSWQITTALFPDSSATPQFSFALRIRACPSDCLVRFVVDGQVAESNGKQSPWIKMTWPANTAQTGASLFVRSGEHTEELREQHGTWGLFRLLETAHMQWNAQEGTITLQWPVHHSSMPVTLELRPDRTTTPFALRQRSPNSRVQPMALFRDHDSIPPTSLWADGTTCASHQATGVSK